MKIIYRITVLCCFVMSMTACYEDLGNYDYKEISGIQATFVQDTFSVFRGDTLTIVPQLIFSAGCVDADFTYEWEAVITDREVGIDTVLRMKLGDTKVLHDQILLRDRAKPYKLYFYATEKSTGVRHYFNVWLEVFSSINKGWVVLCDVEDKMRVDMISMNMDTTRVIRDILSVIDAGLPEHAGKPLSMSVFRDGIPYRYGINTSTGSFVIDKSTFKYTNPIDWSFFTDIPSDFFVQTIFNNTYDFAISGQGDVYSKSTSNTGSGFGEALNRFSTAPDILIPIFPLAAFAQTAPAGQLGRMQKRCFFDLKSKGFIEHATQAALNCVPIAHDKTHTLFNFSDIRKELVTIVNTSFRIPKTGHFSVTYAIFRDEEKTWLYGFEVPGGTRKAKQHYVQELPMEAHNSRLYVADNKTGFLYYSDGKGIYGWDPLTKKSLSIGSVTEEGEEISLLKYQYRPFPPVGYELGIGVYHPDASETTGRLSFYSVNTLDGKLISTGESYDGLGKIVDFIDK